MLELLGLPAQASAHAAQIDGMIVILHWLMAVLFVGWGIFFIYCYDCYWKRDQRSRSQSVRKFDLGIRPARPCRVLGTLT